MATILLKPTGIKNKRVRVRLRAEPPGAMLATRGVNTTESQEDQNTLRQSQPKVLTQAAAPFGTIEISNMAIIRDSVGQPTHQFTNTHHEFTDFHLIS